MPIFLLAAFAAELPITGALGALASVGLAYWLAEVVRQGGQRTEARLKRKWHGMPTSRLLDAEQGSSPVDACRRRAALERVTGQTLPSKSEEATDPQKAAAETERIVHLGISRVRSSGTEADLLQAENISYGFRRNLRALKVYGLISVGLSMAVSSTLLTFAPLVAMCILALDVLIALLWFGVVRDDWVCEQADKYSERYYIAIESLASERSAKKKRARSSNQK